MSDVRNEGGTGDELAPGAGQRPGPEDLAPLAEEPRAEDTAQWPAGPGTDPAAGPTGAGSAGPAQPGAPWWAGSAQAGYGPGGPGGPGGWTPGGAWGWTPHGGGWGPPPSGERGHREARRRPLMMAVAAALTALAVLVGVAIGYNVWNGTPTTPTSSTSPLSPGNRSGTSSTSTTAASKTSSASGAPSDISAIAAKVQPGMVDINTVLGDATAEAAGTGMVLTSTGKVLTNNHVIEGATSISVTDLGNGQTYSATVLGYAHTADVAVIQLKNASGLKTVSIGNSSNVSVGDAVVGIGNAGGTGGTPSKAGGSVTGLNQAITASDQGSGTTEHLTGLIESNANIQPGDSGGPLVNIAGQVVGMDTAASAAQGFTFNGAATGQGYSIPINAAISIAKQIEGGKASKTVHLGQTAFLGVAVVPSSSTTRTRPGFGLGTPTATPGSRGTGTSGSATASGTGALVTRVLSGTPAQTAGLAHGDLITSLGGMAVTSPNALTKAIEQYHPGNTVKVVWTTPSGPSQSATVALVNGPAG